MLINHYFQLNIPANRSVVAAAAAAGTTSYYATVTGWALRLYENTFVRWVQRFYLAWKWHFMDPPDVCAALTGSPASFWQQHTVECQDRISRDFTAWVVYAECLVLLLCYLRCCWWRRL